MHPICDTDYKRLQEQVKNLRESLPNKRLYIEGMDRLLTAFLELMDAEGPYTVPRTAAQLYRMAHVSENVFERNFGSLDGLILITQGIVAMELDTHIGMFISLPYEITLNRAFDYIACKDTNIDLSRKIRMHFAVRRFGINFWKTAFRSLFAVISEGWTEQSPEAKGFLFELYISNWITVLRIWEKTDFDGTLIPICKRLLMLLNTVTIKQISDLATLTDPFVKAETIIEPTIVR